jgi:hypothetical protein
MGGFLIEFLSLVDEIDADQSIGHRAETRPNLDPFKNHKGSGPEKTRSVARSSNIEVL